MENIQVELINLVVAVLTACAGVATRYVVAFLKKKGLISQMENNKEIVRIVVHAVEQMYKELKGDEKLTQAKIEVVKIMKEKNIKITEQEIDLMIEAMVREMNASKNEELKK
ncbi:holin [Bacillus phage PBC2]|uniref:Putative holin n=1 Tax=Bacillus phage PBC2 TaxID=1675029 RepID=A0A218KCA0_9CAUD|nr:holin [Bacillus phage PBC2]AKQ08510.1 putative holin [Bacillus phage PBC2]UUV45946.1 holin [Bacillus phage vB_BanS-Thrax1]UUV46449.1 holin [Bacillus phage vB_BanS-Thrax3]